MSDAALSADGLISFVIGSVLLALNFLGIIHELGHKLRRGSSGKRFLVFCERRRKHLTKVLERVYQLRYVSLFILLAMSISTISPVATLMGIEENVVSNACRNLQNAGALSDAQPVDACKKISKTKGYTYVELTFFSSRNHLLQVAVWPLVAVVYGMIAAGFVRMFRQHPNQPFAEIVEKAPRLYHLALGLLMLLSFVAGWIQNRIGS